MEPKTEEELAEAVKSAKGPLQIRGGGTRPLGDPVTGELLSTAKLSGITLYEPGALTLVAQAGTPLIEIEAALAKEGQRLPFEPMDHRVLMGSTGESTIGGVVAANISGPRRIQAGACRDSLIGVRFVDGRGEIIKNGGRVMKNVTGYDLVKLMAGSYGTLGVLSEVSFKLLPAASSIACLLVKEDASAGIATMSAALGSPFEVSGAAHRAGRTYIRIEGLEASVGYRAEQLKGLIGASGVLTDRDEVSAIWAGIANVTDMPEDHDIWRLSVKPSDAPALLSAIEGAHTLLDWGGGLIWAAVAPGTDLRATAPQIAGHRTLVRAAPATRKALGSFQPEPAPLAAITRGIRAKFDPRGILNPGIMA